MSCHPQSGTGFLDGALGAVERAEVEALRARLRALRSPEPRPSFVEDLRARFRAEAPADPWVLPLAAGLGLVSALVRRSPRPAHR